MSGLAHRRNFSSGSSIATPPAASTSLADDRARNGQRGPFGVRYWGVGNESWGCGGKFIPEDYCREYRRFTDWLPQYGVPLFLIAAGPDGNNHDWTRRFLARWADGQRAPIQGWAPHYYCGTTGHALDFSQDQWYEQLHKANRMETLVTDQWSILGEFDPQHRIKLVIDEWGSWQPAGTEVNKRHLYEQMSTLRDALVAALTLDTINRHAEKIDMANIAQLVNNLHSLFLADGDRFVATPNYHVYTMYRPHQGAKGVRFNVEAPDIAFKTRDIERRIFRVAGSSSVADRKMLTVTLVHIHATEPAELLVRLRGGTAEQVLQTVLSHSTLNAHNTFEQRDNLVPKTSQVAAHGSELKCGLAPASINRFDIRLA
jgi:alpha-L-arabinofuranosidase